MASEGYVAELTREERIVKAKELLRIWSRKDEDINEKVWKHIDANIENMMNKAMNDKAYEAFAYLYELQEIIDFKEVHNLTNQLIVLQTPPNPNERKR